MSACVRAAGLLAACLACAAPALAATPKEIDAALRKGTDWLKARHTQGGGGGGVTDGYGIGSTCLSGLALLEAGVPANDPAVKRITESVRQAAYTQTRTYQVSLCLMYLDRLGEPADVPLIQTLAVRLLIGQSAQGGWTYNSVTGVAAADEQRLRAMKPGQPGKLHPDVEEYARALRANRAGGTDPGLSVIDDNSNTQFAVLALWLARKHGVPVDGALDLIERRYLATQRRTGGWGYSGPTAGAGPGVVDVEGSPSMFCAGLIGLATGVARREEKLRPKDEPAKPEPEPKPKSGEPKKNPDDPFFTPPKKPADDPQKKPPQRPLTPTDRAVQAALAGLGGHLAESARAGRGALVLRSEGLHGTNDMYFLWSVERVGVVYGLDKIGGVDWYEAGAHSLVYTQSQDGSWGGNTGYGGEVSTAFAVLFLSKSNLARDLSGKVQKETGTEMRAGNASGPSPRPGDGTAGTTNPNPNPPPFVPGATGNQAATLAAELLRSTDKDWGAVLGKLRDTKGTVHTQALLGAVYRLDGDRRKAAREALAERLTRMTAATLRAMAKDEDSELRRAAVLAMAMKDDKAHIPDLVAAILDEEDLVVRAARAGLKSLTGGEDFGPAANATTGEKFLATESWKKWMAAQKK
jgi:hypothetical protein